MMDGTLDLQISSETVAAGAPIPNDPTIPMSLPPLEKTNM